jgi:hypothetical protein
MKLIQNLKHSIPLILVIAFLMPLSGWSQKRIKPPKRASKVKSVDQFVKHSFEMYHKVFVYDSLSKAGVEIPAEIEDELTERIERDVDSLLQVVPDLVDDISDAPFLRQAKATLNLNRSKKVLKFCMTTVKAYVLGTEEEDEDDN